MGQSSTFYEIKKTDFDKIKDKPSLFKISETESLETLEQNAFGIEFILKKILDSKHHGTVEQIFCPKDFLGEKPDYENIDFNQVVLDELADNSIGYIAPDKIAEIDNLLQTLTVNGLEKNYNSSELNSNGIYPEVWHDDESNNQAFNKRHIVEGIEQLKAIFGRAKRNRNYLFVFPG